MSDELTRRAFIGTAAVVVLGPVVDAQRAADGIWNRRQEWS